MRPRSAVKPEATRTSEEKRTRATLVPLPISPMKFEIASFASAIGRPAMLPLVSISKTTPALVS